MTLEEARKRTEASLARKRINVGLANGTSSGGDTPSSPATSGAMDSLLEKLRAAAPQARDQRDRRRRARLKERHQVRVASGQKMPENMMSEAGDGNENEGSRTKDDNGDVAQPENGQLGVPDPESETADVNKDAHVSEGEDVADRAASMLQGLRNNTDANGERLRRRRESAEEERRNRRLRRRHGAGSGSKDSAEGSMLSSVREPSPPRSESAEPDDGATTHEKDEDDAASRQAPSIVVSPTSENHDRSPDESAEGPPPAKPSEPSD